MSDGVTRADYTDGDVDGARRLCLLIAQRLAGFEDDLVVVGGIVPTLLIGVPEPSSGVEPHLGTKDVDLGLALRLVEGERYKEVSRRLRAVGFTRDVNPQGNLVSQRWILPGLRGVSLDFLIHQDRREIHESRVWRLEPDFGVYLIPGLQLAFEDRRRVPLGPPPAVGQEAPAIQVCEAGAFVVLKALALRHRDKAKDAYDLDWLLQGYPGGVDAVAARVRALPAWEVKADALRILGEVFERTDSRGPAQVARFLGNAADEAVRADTHARVQQLLEALRTR